MVSKRITVCFCRLRSGKEPVREWLLSLSREFIKKQRKTPPQDLALARRRMREVLDALRRKGG